MHESGSDALGETGGQPRFVTVTAALAVGVGLLAPFAWLAFIPTGLQAVLDVAIAASLCAPVAAIAALVIRNAVEPHGAQLGRWLFRVGVAIALFDVAVLLAFVHVSAARV